MKKGNKSKNSLVAFGSIILIHMRSKG